MPRRVGASATVQRVGTRPAIFLDRDGTIIEDRGYIADPSEVVFYRDTVEALGSLQQRFMLFIVTNQSGIGRGLLSPDDVERVNAHIVRTLAGHGIAIGEVYCCPHRREDGCPCIKPKPYFVLQAARDHALDLASSYVIGDHPHDVELAGNVGAHGIYVLSGHGRRHRHEVTAPCTVVEGIRAAAHVTTLRGVARGGVLQPGAPRLPQ